MSLRQTGGFLGFSIEFSVVNQVLGKNSTLIQPAFLNLMSNIVQRAGQVYVRVGGNTQETASLVQSIPDGKVLEKNYGNTTNPTGTPPVIFTPDVIYMMGNISKMTNVRWYMGIPFNDTNWRLQIAEYGQAVLGDYLVGLQAGNEPDLYERHTIRVPYGPYDYTADLGLLIQAMAADPLILNNKQLIGPSTGSGDWSAEDTFAAGFFNYSANLASVAVEHYPTDNCFGQFGFGTNRSGQDMFPTFLNHTSGQSIVSQFSNAAAIAQTNNKPFIMFETNTASCGGFAGLSDSFGAALWALDYGLQMAYVNFTQALLHVGGQNVFYNPFTPPPTNQSTFHHWTVGPVYYSALVMAEVIGSSNLSQVVDLYANNANIYTPAYGIYEGSQVVRVVLFNYVTDSSGANDYTATISIGGGQTGQANGTPASVKVKYLAASSVAQKGNFTWAGQTFGDIFQSDGRPMGNVDIQTIQCDQTANTCQIKVPAPSVAVVFFSDSALSEADGGPSTTFGTTTLTKTANTATVDPSLLATSNGHSGMEAHLGSTSKGSSGTFGMVHAVPGVVVLVAAAAGAAMLGRSMVG
jgi:hypothetical protein